MSVSYPVPADPRRPPTVLTVVRDAELAAPIDWSPWYLTDEEDMGQSPEQTQIIDELKSSIRQLLRERGERERFVDSDAFFGWMQAEPLVRVSPDVYLLEREPPDPLPRSFQTWRDGHAPPRLAVEIVSEDWQKDYVQGPAKYAQLGVDELVVFDPGVAAGRVEEEGRVTLQAFRRTADGLFVWSYAGDGPLACESLDAWLVVRMGPKGPRLRVARDPSGTDLVPTAEEAAEHEGERADREARRAEQEARRAEQEARRAEQEARRAEQAARLAEQEARRADEERSARLALEAELQRLRAALAGTRTPGEG